MKNIKGFTLIELLVVIAILGILAGVVLVAIDPSARIKEANDSGSKSGVSQVAQAMEACYTNNSGSYANCDTVAELSTGTYLKISPAGVTICASGSDKNVYSSMQATATNSTFFVYDSGTGVAATATAAGCA